MSKLFVNNTNIPVSNFVITAYDKNGKELSPEDIEKTGVKFTFRKVDNNITNDLAELNDDQSEFEWLQNQNKYLLRRVEHYKKLATMFQIENEPLKQEIEELRTLQKQWESNK